MNVGIVASAARKTGGDSAATMPVTVSNGTDYVSAYSPIGDQVTYTPVNGPSAAIIYKAPGSGPAYIHWPTFAVHPLHYVNPEKSFWNRTLYLAVAFEINGWQELVGQGSNPAHGTDPGTYRLFANIGGAGANNIPIYFRYQVTCERDLLLGGSSSVSASVYNGGGIRIFTAYIGPDTQKCLINAQHIKDSPRTGLSLSESAILSPVRIMNQFKGKLYDMRVYDGEHTDTEVQTTCEDIAHALGVTL